MPKGPDRRFDPDEWDMSAGEQGYNPDEWDFSAGSPPRRRPLRPGDPISESDFAPEPDDPDKERRKISRRRLILGGAGLGIGTVVAAEIAKRTDTDIGKAIRLMDAYAKIQNIQDELDQAQQEFNTDTAAVLSDPEGYTAKLKKIRETVEELTKEVEKINKDGIRVNSGMVYLKQKRIEAALARFNNENFSKVFKALNVYMGAVRKINKGITEVRRKIAGLGRKAGSIIGVPVGGFASKFINEQAAKNLKNLSGDIEVAGVTIPLRALSQFALEAQNVASALVKLRDELEKMSDPDIKITNNSYVNAFSTSPRDDMVKAVFKVADILRENRDGDFSDEEVQTMQRFLVKYGYLVQMGDEDPVNGKYDKSTAAALKKFVGIIESAPGFREEYEKQQERGVQRPVVARGKQVKDLQDFLAMSGYMSYEQVDSAFGPTTYAASVSCTYDWDKYEKENE